MERKQKKVVIAGATGLIGSRLSMQLAKSDYKVSALVRNPEKAFESLQHYNIELIEWSIETSVNVTAEFIDGADGVINLAGASVAGKRWNDSVKQELYDSRILSTRQLANAIRMCQNIPAVFIVSNGTGFYGDRKNEKLTEEASAGGDFLAKLCADWEKEALAVSNLCRVVSVRTGVVLAKDDGALKELSKPFKYFLGGWLGSGKQWFPWVHIEDVISIFKFALENDSIKGAINAVSPETVTNKEFCKDLGKEMNKPCLFPVPGFVLKLAAGEFAFSLLTGQKVIPEKLKKNNFEFRFNKLKPALENLLQ